MSAAVEGPRDDGTDPASSGGRSNDIHGPRSPDLRSALRVARIEGAERSQAIAAVQGADVARLELLKERLAPVLAQVPADVDLFDAVVVPGPQPRLFIDMIGFVEMAHDRRRYRLVQDTRDGRLILVETERLDVMADAVTAYIARRLVEREKTLASRHALEIVPAATAAAPGRVRRVARIGLEYLGLAALVVLLWVFGHVLYQWVVTASP